MRLCFSLCWSKPQTVEQPAPPAHSVRFSSNTRLPASPGAGDALSGSPAAPATSGALAPAASPAPQVSATAALPTMPVSVAPADPLVVAAGHSVERYREALEAAAAENEREALACAMLKDADFRVRMSINLVLLPATVLRVPEGALFAAFLAGLQDTSDYVRCMAMIGLSNQFMPTPDSATALAAALQDGNREVRLAAAKALAKYEGDGVLRSFVPASEQLAAYRGSIEDTDEGSRLVAISGDVGHLTDLHFIPGYGDGYILSFIDSLNSPRLAAV